MQLIRSVDVFKSFWRERMPRQDGPVGLTIGNFDGMHLGHRALFDRLSSELEAHSPSGVRGRRVLVTFHPHPRRYFGGLARGAGRPAREEHLCLTTVREKLRLAEAAGFDTFLLLRFTRELSELSPKTFIRRYIAGALQASVVVVGHDWAFGKERSGSAELLQELGADLGFRTVIVDPVEVGGVRVASRLIRESLAEGDLERAHLFLGRPYCVDGRVVFGLGRGRTLGFPTANLDLAGQVVPADGVYACRAEVEGRVFTAVTNVGTRPTFEGPVKRTVEAHLAEAPDIDLYYKRLRLEFLKRLRPERKFADAAELRTQIANDIRDALAVPGLGA